ncbi:hypothetical protein [Streptomyces sp. N35]|uniref:hypothetical protein n=1 Tax=Streptomyces sp. N35 TaxID=2795730 RepID=UPI0018F6E8F7|nr:hypothetical protein [Streptomyces sp. N35]
MPETPTSRLGLHRPLNNGSELVNVQTDLNQNLDKLDLAAGFQIVTSGTRPAAPYAGKPITESDTSYRTYFSNGTAPASASWVQIPNSSSTYNADLVLVDGKDFVVGTRRIRNQLHAATTTVANTVAETVVATMTIPANDPVAGAIYRVEAWGIASVTGTPTFTVQARLGGVAGTSMGTTGAITASTGVTTRAWNARFDLVCAVAGGGGSWRPSLAVYQDVAVAALPGQYRQIQQAAAVARSTTTAADMVITWTWGTASASNTATCQGVIAQRIA